MVIDSAKDCVLSTITSLIVWIAAAFLPKSAYKLSTLLPKEKSSSRRAEYSVQTPTEPEPLPINSLSDPTNLGFTLTKTPSNLSAVATKPVSVFSIADFTWSKASAVAFFFNSSETYSVLNLSIPSVIAFVVSTDVK